MEDKKNTITFKGAPLTLVGSQVKVGKPAPDCVVIGNDMSAVKLSDFQGKVRVICSVPSLDTPVCDTETRKFNEHAASLGENVKILVISMDLPFAQKRWCGAAGVKNVLTLSDYKDSEFANTYGVLVKELGLLARAIFVVDNKGVIRYKEIVSELTNEPDYEAALKAVKEIK
jgi:thiol peroxidase